MPAGILALDLATATGWAALTALDAEPDFGTFRVAGRGVSIGAFGVSYREWLGGMIDLIQPQLIGFEAPFVSAGVANADTARKLMGLAWETEVVCEERRRGDARFRHLRVVEANNSTIRKWMTGHGRYGSSAEGKRQMILACQQRGWRPANDNEADALGQLAYLCHCYAPDSRHARAQLFAGADRGRRRGAA